MSPAPLFVDEPDSSPVVIATNALSKKRFPKKVIFAGLTIVFVIAAVGLGVFTITNRTQRKSVSITPNQSLSPTKQLKKSIYDAFGSSNQYQNIIDYTNLAKSEPDSTTRYEYYKKVFSKTHAAYTNTKDSKMLLVLYQLKDLATASPAYKEGDFVIQK